MPRPIQFATLAGLVLVSVGVAVLVVQVRQLLRGQEAVMARFDELDTDITELRQAVADAAARVEAAVDRLTDDTADQEQIEEARTEVKAAIEQLKAIAPEPTPEPEPEPEPAPES